MMKKFSYVALVVPALFISVSTTSFNATAQDAEQQRPASKQFIDILPTVMSSEDTAAPPIEEEAPIVRLTPDKSEIIHLDEPALSIIVGNPLHVNIMADSPTTLVLVPRTPGATYFTVLGKHDQIIMQRHIIVASPKEDYVRIKKTCSGENSENCQKTSVYYCPDMCHEIGIVQDSKESSGTSSSNDVADQGDITNSNAGDIKPQTEVEQ